MWVAGDVSSGDVRPGVVPGLVLLLGEPSAVGTDREWSRRRGRDRAQSRRAEVPTDGTLHLVPLPVTE